MTIVQTLIKRQIEAIALYCVNICIPTITKWKKQLSRRSDIDSCVLLLELLHQDFIVALIFIIILNLQ